VSTPHMRGFTLIEVMIAFAILGLALGALYGAFENALARSRHDVRFREGTMIAQSLLARAGSEIPRGQDNYREDWNGYTYELTQEPASSAEGSSAVLQPSVRVTTTVRWSEGGKSREIRISTLELVSEAGSR
jgi:general secretion pathway protein I